MHPLNQTSFPNWHSTVSFNQYQQPVPSQQFMSASNNVQHQNYAPPVQFAHVSRFFPFGQHDIHDLIIDDTNLPPSSTPNVFGLSTNSNANQGMELSSISSSHAIQSSPTASRTRQKLKRKRVTITSEIFEILCHYFYKDTVSNPGNLQLICQKTGLRYWQVQRWFANRRHSDKKKKEKTGLDMRNLWLSNQSKSAMNEDTTSGDTNLPVNRC